MAVYTHLSDNDIRGHLQHYALGELKSFDGIAEGVENTNYKITTTSGDYILTLFEGRMNTADLPFYLGFMNHVKEKGLPAPGVVPAINGALFIPLKNISASITTFLKGSWPRTPALTHVASVGDLAARLHMAGKDFKGHRANTLGLPEWRRLIEACGHKADDLEPGLAGQLQRELNWLENSAPALKHPLPHGVVHADLFPDNVFFDGDMLSGVIDFYFSCTETWLYDLMITLNAWCFDAISGLDKNKCGALLKAYHRARPLTSDELACLPAFGRMAAMRIIATRLYDLLHPKPGALGTAKDPLEHVRILRYHQMAHSLEHYGFHERH